jgi:3'(2'), 5'-bisphosphate nucleotidase
MSEQERKALAEALCLIAERAGQEILAIYGRDFEVRGKQDSSPVTDADERAEALILEGLARDAPGIPVVAEESVAAGRTPDVAGRPFFLVDPLDGTREFISRNGEFTVNVALVEDGMPTAGVVHLPALDETYWTDGGDEAWRRRCGGEAERIACRRPGEQLVVVASRSHRDARTDEFLADYPVGELISAGSSLKLCRVAEGRADMYPRLGRTMEWDIAAGHAVLAAAGGSVRTLAGEPLRYGKPGLDNPFFVARGIT